MTDEFDEWAEDKATEEFLRQHDAENAKLRVKLKEYKSHNKRLSAALADASDKIDVALGISSIERPPPILKPGPHGGRHATAVAIASDWHVGERVDSGSVLGLNEHSPEVARERAESFAHGLDWMIRRLRCGNDQELGYQIDTLVLALLGDFIGGYIHAELEESNYLTPIEEIELATDLVAGVIDYVMEHSGIERLVLPCVGGNHDRTTQKNRVGTQCRNSFAHLNYKNLARIYKRDPRIQFDIAEGSMMYTSIYDTRMRWIHGHEIRYNGGSGGITVPLRKKIDRWNKSEWADITCLGHFHTCLDLDYAVINGSTKGYDPFAMAFGFEYERPRQAFFLIDKEHGKRDFSPINVGPDLRPRMVRVPRVTTP
jgi:hypothetical protein